MQQKEILPAFICLFSGLPSPAGRGDSDYSVSPTRTCSNCGRNDCILPKPLKEKKEHVPVTLSCSTNSYSMIQTITLKFITTENFRQNRSSLIYTLRLDYYDHPDDSEVHHQAFNFLPNIKKRNTYVLTFLYKVTGFCDCINTFRDVFCPGNKCN